MEPPHTANEQADRPFTIAQVNLTRNLIVDAAVDILGSFGLGDMTMRRVATHLGVAPGALYWHIANKQELLSAIAERILAPVLVDGADTNPTAYSRELRDALLSHRDGAEIVASSFAQPGSTLRHTLEARLMATLTLVSADPDSAATGASALIHLLLGACVQAQSSQQLAELAGASEESSRSAAREAIDDQVALLIAGITRTGR